MSPHRNRRTRVVRVDRDHPSPAAMADAGAVIRAGGLVGAFGRVDDAAGKVVELPPFPGIEPGQDIVLKSGHDGQNPVK